MSKYHFDPEKILDKFTPETYGNLTYSAEDVIEAMRRFGRLVRDSTLEWAMDQSCGDVIKMENITLGKTSKDLEI